MSLSKYELRIKPISDIVLPLIIIVVALIFGYFINIFEYKISILLMLLLIGIVSSLKFPVLPAFFALLVVVDVIPFPKGGRIYPYFIVAMTLFTIFIGYFKASRIIVNWRPFLPALFFVFVMSSGYVYGTLYLNNSSGYALAEFQCVFAWLFSPALMICFKENNRADMLLRFLLLIGIVISAVTIFQYVTGFSFGARVEQLETLGNVNAGITRATIPAKLFVLFVLFTLVGWMASGQVSLFRILLLLPFVFLIAFAILVSFGRALWIGAFMGVILTSLFLGRRHFLVIVGLVVIFGLTSSLLLEVFNPRVANAATERALSVFREGASNSSFGWRVTENFFATRSIYKNPFLGIGLGGEYKPPLVAAAVFPNQTSYIHNSYYYFVLKLGFFGLLVPIFIVIYFTYSGVNLIRLTSNYLQRSAVASGIACIWVMSLMGGTQPEWISVSSIAFLACFLAFITMLKSILPHNIVTDEASTSRLKFIDKRTNL